MLTDDPSVYNVRYMQIIPERTVLNSINLEKSEFKDGSIVLYGDPVFDGFSINLQSGLVKHEIYNRLLEPLINKHTRLHLWFRMDECDACQVYFFQSNGGKLYAKMDAITLQIVRMYDETQYMFFYDKNYKNEDIITVLKDHKFLMAFQGDKKRFFQLASDPKKIMVML